MTSASAKSTLTGTVVSSRLPEDVIKQRVHRIHQDVLAHSPYLRAADFTRIHPQDVEFLFRAYDERFFSGQCQQVLAGRRITFRLAPRMTQSGGTTTRYTAKSGEVRFEIAIACSMLFDAFGTNDRQISVCGLDCENRLEALQRIIEHEIVHLIEQLCWENSDCTATRFQDIAARLFRHRAHTHQLITRRERAAASGIRVGARVIFTYEGRRLTGRVNRITKRASILVEDADGQQYVDGVRYKTYYVPIPLLEPVAEAK